MTVNLQKQRTGIHRLWHALSYSLSGLRMGWGEKAFKQEAIVFFVLSPVAVLIGASWVEIALLIGSIIFVMVTELLNTAVESAIDRIGPQWHDLSKRAKDMGSAAVLLSLILCVGVWVAAIWQYIHHT